MSYAQIWPRMGAIVEGFATDDFIQREFNAYEDDWKNESIQQAVTLLRSHFGGRGRWYQLPSKPLHVFGFWFKPSIKGIWFVDGRAYAVLINARKNQRLRRDDLRFLARGIYELHCIDDPNDPVPLVVDLSAPEIGKERHICVHVMPHTDAITLEEFDSSVRQFLRALKLAGVAVPSTDDALNIVDMFKGRR